MAKVRVIKTYVLELSESEADLIRHTLYKFWSNKDAHPANKRMAAEIVDAIELAKEDSR